MNSVIAEYLSLRDQFAMAALPLAAVCSLAAPTDIADFAYAVADAMLAKRKQGQNPAQAKKPLGTE